MPPRRRYLKPTGTSGTERLIGLALQSGELSPEECDILSYYAKELHDTTHPLCEKHKCETSMSSS